ncbi:MAG: thioredoxin [Planctomycetota bacterium]
MRHVFGIAIATMLLVAGCEQSAPVAPTASPEGPVSSTAGHAYVELDEARFEEVVLQSDKPVLVDFYATWCPPCNAVAPIVENLAAQYAGRVVVAKVNVDNNQGLAQQYKVQSIPTFALFKGGRLLDQKVGGLSAGELDQFIQQAL